MGACKRAFPALLTICICLMLLAGRLWCIIYFMRPFFLNSYCIPVSHASVCFCFSFICISFSSFRRAFYFYFAFSTTCGKGRREWALRFHSGRRGSGAVLSQGLFGGSPPVIMLIDFPSSLLTSSLACHFPACFHNMDSSLVLFLSAGVSQCLRKGARGGNSWLEEGGR